MTKLLLQFSKFLGFLASKLLMQITLSIMITHINCSWNDEYELLIDSIIHLCKFKLSCYIPWLQFTLDLGFGLFFLGTEVWTQGFTLPPESFRQPQEVVFEREGNKSSVSTNDNTHPGGVCSLMNFYLWFIFYFYCFFRSAKHLVHNRWVLHYWASLPRRNLSGMS
jgi:hypothetical protein